MTRSTAPVAARHREILARGDLVPPLPELVVRLLALLGRSETEPRHVEEVLRLDPLLTARLLAMVNSPWYGLNRAITTPREAVMVVGFRGVRTLVVAASTAKLLQRDYTIYGHQRKGLWLHAVCVAAVAKKLARTLRFDAERAEQLFVAGLLHDIGMLLLAPLLRTQPHYWLHDTTVVEAEQKAVGMDHAEAGALVAAMWNLSHEVQTILAAHHETAPADSGSPVAIIRLADALAEECGIGYLPGHVPAVTVRPADLAALSLSPSSWPTLREELIAAMQEAQDSLAQNGWDAG